MEDYNKNLSDHLIEEALNGSDDPNVAVAALMRASATILERLLGSTEGAIAVMSSTLSKAAALCRAQIEPNTRH